MARAAAGDPEAFAAFYRAYDERVLRFFARRVLDGEVALDLTAEAFAVALESRVQFRGRTTEEEQGWLFAIAHGLLARYYQRAKSEREAIHRVGVAMPHLEAWEHDRIEDIAGLDELPEQLARALDQLSFDQRTAVELRVIQDASYLEMARRLEVSEDVARARVSRALRALSQLLAPASESTEGSA